jgi:hypothetical protein
MSGLMSGATSGAKPGVPTSVTALLAAAVMLAPAVARADRDVYDPPDSERSFARPAGQVVVHYTTVGVDAALAGDLDGSGVPDFVEEVADVADDVLTRLGADHGFRPPLGDRDHEDDGGDERLDIYLANFVGGSDGLFVVEECTDQAPFHCAGFIGMENDFAGFSYPSVDLAIRVLVSHELFHTVQAAYDPDQLAVWHEGTATWIEELLYPEQGDFERLVAGFMEKPFRPFERSVGGFGDSYAYGAAMWPYFLDLRYGGDIVTAIWERCEDTGSDPDFLDAAAAELIARGTTLEAAWIEFTRWNAETGAYAAPGRYPDAGRLAAALREVPLAAPGTATVGLEGMSARYLPVTGVPAAARIVVDSPEPVAVAVRAAGATVDGGDAVASHHEIVVRGAGALELVVTGTRRLSPAHDVTVAISDAEPPPTLPDAGVDAGAPAEGDDGDGSGCAAGGGGACLTVPLLAAALLLRRRRRARASARPISR